MPTICRTPLFSTIGQENDPRRDLFGKAEEVRCVDAGRLEADGVANDQGACHGVGGWSNCAQDGILYWIVIKRAGKLPNGAFGLQPT